MKKLFSLLLVVSLILGLCACGNNNLQEITDKLNGSSWFATTEKSGNSGTAWTFDNGIVAVLTNIEGQAMGEADKGTFEVEKDCISLTWDNPECGRVKELYYSYKDGSLSLYSDKGKDNALICVKSSSNESNAPSNTKKETISKEKAEELAKQEIVNLCCEESYVSTINIDYGTFDVSKSKLGGLEFNAKGTYLPKDDHGMYGDRQKFTIRLTVSDDGKVTVNSKQFSEAYK